MGLKDITKKLFPDAIAEENYEDDFLGDESQYDEDTVEHAPASSFAPRNSSNVSVASGSSIEMKVVTPKSYDTVTQIADLLLSKKTVLLNLESTNRETARRLIDFLSGVAYALHGDIQKVADNTYAITPSNVAISKGNVGISAETSADAEEVGGSF